MAMISRPKLCTKDTVKNEGLNIWFDSTLNGVEPKVDIILVQGLGAHPYYTWVGRQDKTTTVTNTISRSILSRFIGRGKIRDKANLSVTADEGVFWPKDLLPKHVGPARIATYSYLSAWEKKAFRTSLRECGEQFLNVVHQFRPDDSTRKRPIIFVGHSLGGLVIQQALVLADHSKVFTNLRTSTSGAIFLGVPMQGSGSADILAFITDALGNEQPILETLRAGSPELNALSDDFWSSHGALPAMFFCETNDSRYVPLLKTMTVNVRSSSVVGKRNMLLHTDHSGLNKFREDDENFHLFIPSLKEMVTLAQINSCTKAKCERNDDAPALGMDREISQDLVSVTGRVILPFPKDNDFVGRKAVLEKIEEISHSTEQDSRVALVGLGGIGKSQIAIEYAHQFRAKYPERSVFWVYGTSPARFCTSYTEIAKDLCLSGCDDPKQDQLGLVRRWFQSEASGQWLLVLDNVDDRSFVADYHNKAAKVHEFTLLTHLPRKPGTMMLATSRDRDAAYDLVHQKHNHIIEIDCMDVTDTKALLDVKLDDPQAVEEEKAELIRKLDSIPLAITQAAAYIKRRRMVTILKYLKLLDACEEVPASVLNVDGGDSRRDPGVPNAVFRTWYITLDLIRVQHPKSANLLSIMAMFDRQGIPSFLLDSEAESSTAIGDESDHSNYASSDDHPGGLAGHHESSLVCNSHQSLRRNDRVDTGYQGRSVTKPVTKPVTKSESESPGCKNGTSINTTDCHVGPFHDAIEVLLGFSLVSMEESGETFQMHRLVQLATRRWLENRRLLKHCLNNALHRLVQAYPTDVHEHWKVYQALEPHADCVHERLSRPEQSKSDHARLSYLQAKLYRFRGSYSRAEAAARMAIDGHSDIGERNSERYLSACGELFWAYIGLGAYATAESEILPVLNQAKVIFGEKNETYIDLLRTQGAIFVGQGRYIEAVEILRIAVDLARTFIGNQDSLTLQCSQILAGSLRHLGRLDEAEELCVSTLEIRKRTLDESDPRMLTHMETLGVIHGAQGRTTEAELTLRHVLHLRTELLGEKHPHTVMIKYNIACAMVKQGRLKEAEALEAEVLSALTELLGADHPSTIQTMSTLALTYERQKRYSEALCHLTKAVHLLEGALGYGHPITQENRKLLKKWFRRRQHNHSTKHLVLEAEEQAKSLLQERYSYSLSECLFEFYLQRSHTMQAAESGEDEKRKLFSMSKELVAALQLWTRREWSLGLFVVGKILGWMSREKNALVAFEGMIERIQSYEKQPLDPPGSEINGNTDDGSVRQGLRKFISNSANIYARSVHEEETRRDSKRSATAVTEGGAEAGVDEFRVINTDCTAKSPEHTHKEVVHAHKRIEDQNASVIEDFVESRSKRNHRQKTGILGVLLWCASCKNELRLPSIRYICIGCRCTDLCEACYIRLQVEGTLASDRVSDCKGHKLLAVPEPEWYDRPWGVVSRDGTTLREWAETLLAEFSN